MRHRKGKKDGKIPELSDIPFLEDRHRRPDCQPYRDRAPYAAVPSLKNPCRKRHQLAVVQAWGLKGNHLHFGFDPILLTMGGPLNDEEDMI